MNNMKKTLVSLLMTAAIASTSAFAEEATTVSVRAAAEGTVAKVEAAADLLAKSGDKEEILKLLGEARQLQKEFRYEQTERLRQKAGGFLRNARELVGNGDNQNAAAALKETLATYKSMLDIYNASH